MTDWNSKLYKASKDGNLNDIKEAAQYVDINTIASSKSDTFLSVAAEAGHRQAVEYLISRNADVNRIGKYGKTPIFFAASNGHLEIVKLLISKGANVNRIDSYGDTPLVHSIKSNQYEIAKHLLHAGAAVNRADPSSNATTPLSLAAKSNNLNMMKLLLDFGAQFTIHSAFLEAIDCGHLDIVKLLKERGASVKAKQINGFFPLIKAVETGNFEIVKFLVDHGANVNEKDNNGKTALSAAVVKSDLYTFDYLVHHGADISVAFQELEKYKSKMDFAFYLDYLKKDVTKKLAFSGGVDLKNSGHEGAPTS